MIVHSHCALVHDRDQSLCGRPVFWEAISTLMKSMTAIRPSWGSMLCRTIQEKCENVAPVSTEIQQRSLEDPLSLYGLFERFNVQITEWKSHYLEGNYLVYKYRKLNWLLIPLSMKYDVIFIKGSRGSSYLTIEVRWTPPPPFLKL